MTGRDGSGGVTCWRRPERSSKRGKPGFAPSAIETRRDFPLDDLDFFVGSAAALSAAFLVADSPGAANRCRAWLRFGWRPGIGSCVRPRGPVLSRWASLIDSRSRCRTDEKATTNPTSFGPFGLNKA